MVIYLLLCIISILAGRGVMRLVGIHADSRLSLYLSPAITLAIWALFFGWGVLLGFAVKQIWIMGWVSTGLLAILGLWRADRRVLKDEKGNLFAVVIIPFSMMLPYFWHGMTTYVGSPAPDGWSYIAFGQYLWEYPRGTQGGLAPLHQYASHLSGGRFIAGSLLGFFSPLTGSNGDTQASSGYFLAWTLFVFSSSCMFFVATKNRMGSRFRIIYVALCVFSGWVLNMLKANNYDNALAISFLPAIAGTIGIVEPRDLRWTILLALLLAGIGYCYPEMSPFIFIGASIFLLERILSERKDWTKWLIFLMITTATALILTLPWLRSFVIFFKNQIGAAMASQGPRPGQGMFSELLQHRFLPISFWGLYQNIFIQALLEAWLHLCAVLGLVLFAIAVIGSYHLCRQRDWGILLTVILLLCGMLGMIFHSAYDYGAYKFILLNWWGISFFVVTGMHSLSLRFHRQTCKVLISLVFVLFFALTAARVVGFDKSVFVKSILYYKQVQQIKTLVKHEDVVINVEDPIANQWAVYFLRDISTYLLQYRSYMAQPHVVPLMERAKTIDLSKAHYLLRDLKTSSKSSPMEIVWEGGPYQLCQIPKGREIVITKIDNANGVEEWGGVQGFWIGKGDTLISLSSFKSGECIISLELIRGPSLPEKSERKLLIIMEQGEKQYMNISRDGIHHFRISVVPGRNQIIFRPLDKATVERLANGDTRPLLLGVKGMKIGLE